jgi:hypothetical protein
MDTQTLQTGGLSAGFIFGAALLYKLYHVINHHRIRSRCCGQTLDASIDIDGTTATSPTPSPQKATTSLPAIKISEATQTS